MNELLPLCRVCGNLRGDLSDLCAPCLKAKIEVDDSDRYRMQDTVRDGDRERMDSVRDSFRRGS